MFLETSLVVTIKRSFGAGSLRFLRSNSTSKMLSDLASLRESAVIALTRKDFNRVRWVGVFGSFAVGKQTDNSDVDVVAIEDSLDPSVRVPPETLHLEDIFPRIWGRKVDVVHITPGEDLRGYISVESLLSSRTLYGSDQDPVVIQLRKDAQDILDSGPGLFTNILNDIENTTSTVSGISREKFASTLSTRTDVRDSIVSILDAISIQSTWHPLHDAFWYTVIQPANALRRKINDPKPADANTVTGVNDRIVWEIATTSGPDTLWDIDRRIRKFVFPVFELTHEKIEMCRRLEEMQKEGH